MIEHLAKHKGDYAIAAIAVSLIMTGLYQAASTPAFIEEIQTDSVSNSNGINEGLEFGDEHDFVVSRTDNVSFTVRAKPFRRVDFFFVHPERESRSLHLAALSTDFNGLVTYTGKPDDRLKAGVTYEVGVQVTLPVEGEMIRSLAPYSVTVISE